MPSKFLPPFLSPILLHATLGPFSSVGVDLSVDGLKFRNPNRSPMLVDQIRFSGAPRQYANGCAIEVRLGSIPLTKSTVTLATLAPRYTGPSSITNNTGAGSENSADDVMLTWHLLKPLYVPPGVPLIIRAVRQPCIAGSNDPGEITTLGISVVGRSLPADFPVPKQIDVPWVAETKVNTAITRYVSLDSDLINPHPEPLHVRHFIGSNYTNVVNSDTSSAYGSNPANLTVQMSASNGLMFIREPTPFYLLFPTDRKLLNVEALLQAGEFFRAELEIQSVPAGTTSGLQYLNFTSIAMHGYRRIQTPEGVATP